MDLNIIKSTFTSIEFTTTSNITLMPSNIMLYINNYLLTDFQLTSNNNRYIITSNVFFDGVIALYISFPNLISNVVLLCSTAYLSQSIFTIPLKLFSSLGNKVILSIYKINSEYILSPPECTINITNPVYGNLSTIELNKSVLKNTDLLELYINLNKYSDVKPLDGFYQFELYIQKQ